MITSKHLKNNTELLYLIAKTGLYNIENNANNNKFIIDEFNKLHKNTKKYLNKIKLIQCINENTTGIELIHIFIKYATQIPNKHFNYDPLKIDIAFILNIENKTWTFHNIHKKDMLNEWFSINNTINTKSNIWNNDINKIKQKITQDNPTQTFMVTLEYHENWDQVDTWRIIKLQDKYCFDLLWLIMAITNQINNYKNTNPLPIIPHNPFNKVDITNEDLVEIYQRCKNNNITINKPLEILLSNLDQKNNIIELFETNNLRFVREFREFEDELEIIGYWTQQRTKMTDNETYINIYLDELDFVAEIYLKCQAKTFILPQNYYFKLL